MRFDEIKVGELMTKELITIDKSRKLSDALDLMLKKGIHRLIVTDDGKLCGIITAMDIMETLGSYKYGRSTTSRLHVATAMTKNPLTITPDASIKACAKLMVENRISSLPVVENDELVGIITTTDLLKVLKDDETPIEPIYNKFVITVKPTDRLVHARKLMLDNRIGRVVVVEEGKVVGILSEKDIAKAFGVFKKLSDRYQSSRVRNLIVEDVMTQNVVTASPSERIKDVVSKMLEHDISGLPVLNNDELVGIITKTDLAKYIAEKEE